MVQTQIEKFCGKRGGSSNNNTIKNVPIPTPRPTQENEPSAQAPSNSCKTKYDELLEKCELSTSDTAASCDESNHTKMKNTSNSAQALGQSDTAAVQYACGQAGGLSNSAKDAMKTFRENCSGALESCQSACEELASFLKDNSCWSTLGLNQNMATTLADSKKRSCETYQSQVDDADRAISNYNTTGAGSAACQMAAMGSGSPQEAAAENQKKTFCEANPTYPGCVNNQAANCNDPSQANNKVCVCSKNPDHPICRGTQNAENTSFASSTVDSSSRLPTSQSSLNSGDIPNVPTISHGPRPEGGSGEGIDGRQGGASVVNATIGAGVNPSAMNAAGKEGLDPIALAGAGTYGASGSGGKIISSGAGHSGGRGYQESSPKDSSANKNPDLRQFLPGGLRDPHRLYGNAGPVGLDGITGPHSDIWKKIRNRYLILQNSLEP